MHIYLTNEDVNYTIEQNCTIHTLKNDDINIFQFDDNNAKKIYKSEINPDHIKYTNQIINIFQDISINENIKNNEFVLVMDNDLLLCDNFFAKTKVISTQLNISADIVILGDNNKYDFNKDYVPRHASRQAYHRFNKKADAYFYVKYDDNDAGMYCFLIRKNTATKIYKSYTKNLSYSILIPEFNMLDNSTIKITAVYVRGVFAIKQNYSLTNNLISIKKNYLQKKLESFNNYMIAYLKQLKIVANLDTNKYNNL